jgi:membrane protein DedA with SNARE-associated domain
VEQWVVNEVGAHGYVAVFALMVLGSACIPIPSEAVMLFGGALAGGVTAAGAHVHLNLAGIVLAGLAGNLVGSLVAYAVGRAGGRPLLDRYGKYVLLRKGELDKAEEFFIKHGQSAVFLGRMVPLVRAFVSLPAGIAQMPAVPFTVLTLLGSPRACDRGGLAGEPLEVRLQCVHAYQHRRRGRGSPAGSVVGVAQDPGTGHHTGFCYFRYFRGFSQGLTRPSTGRP